MAEKTIQEQASETLARARRLEEKLEKTEAALAEARLNFDTMAQTHMEERISYNKQAADEREKMRAHYEKELNETRKNGRRIVIALLTMFAVIAIFVGCLVYNFLNSFETIQTVDFDQNAEVGQTGNSNIYDGIEYIYGKE